MEEMGLKANKNKARLVDDVILLCQVPSQNKQYHFQNNET